MSYNSSRRTAGMYAAGVLADLRALIIAYFTRGTANTAAASIIWIVGLWATSEFLGELQVPGPRFVYAIALQGILTNGQGPIWDTTQRVGRRGAFIIGIAAVLIDIGLNVGGLWIYVQRLGDTTFWAAVQAVANNSNPPTALTCFLLTLGLSAIVAVGPEALWDL